MQTDVFLPAPARGSQCNARFSACIVALAGSAVAGQRDDDMDKASTIRRVPVAAQERVGGWRTAACVCHSRSSWDPSPAEGTAGMSDVPEPWLEIFFGPPFGVGGWVGDGAGKGGVNDLTRRFQSRTMRLTPP